MKTFDRDFSFDPFRYRGSDSGRCRACRGMLVMFALLGLCCAGLTCQARGGDPDVELRVRVAIAIAAASDAPPAKAALGPADCGGICRTDLDACRAEALKAGRPIVLFVAGPTCEGRAAELPATAIACRVAEYDQDGAKPTAKRVVILLRGNGRPEGGADPAKLYVRASLAGDVAGTTIAAQLRELDAPAVPPPLASPAAASAASIDWTFSAKPAAMTGECRTCTSPPASPVARFLRGR